MKRISTAQLRRWVLVGLGVGTLVSLLLGILLTDDWGGLLLDVGAEFGGALATYGLLELFIKRREEEETKKTALIAQMGSSVKDVAVAAAEELRRQGWLRDGSLQGVYLGWANLQGTILTRANLEGAPLNGANLQGAILRGANLQGAILRGANLQGARLGWANLAGAHLAEANLQGADLMGAKLQGADLLWANLDGAILLLAQLQGADLLETKLQEGYLFGANPQDAKLSEDTTLPDGTNWTPDTDMARFTDPDHPDFWPPDA